MKTTLKWKEALRNMPPLHHKIPGEEFDWAKSEVMKWISAQPDVLTKLFNVIKEEITYSHETGRWQGKSVGIKNESQ